MPSKRFSVVAAVTTLALTIPGCAGDSETGSPSVPGSSVLPSRSASPAKPLPTPAPTPAPAAPPTTKAAPAKPPAKPRTAAELQKALLVLADLPPGFAIDPDEEADDGDLASSKRGCARLVALENADRLPGAKATAHLSHSAEKDWRWIFQGLVAMGSAGEVAAVLRTYRTAVPTCRSVVLIDRTIRWTMAVHDASGPEFGTNSVVIRYTVTGSGPKGLKIHRVLSGVGNVLVILMVIGLAGDAAGATKIAGDKVRAVLGGATTGT